MFPFHHARSTFRVELIKTNKRKVHDFADIAITNSVVLSLRRPAHSAVIFALVDGYRHHHQEPGFPWVDPTRSAEAVARRYDATVPQRERGELVEFLIVTGPNVIGKVVTGFRSAQKVDMISTSASYSDAERAASEQKSTPQASVATP